MANKYMKFLASRLMGTGVDTLVLWMLTRLVFDTYIGKYIVAPTISFEAAMFTNFLLSYFWIWKNRIASHRAKIFLTRLAVFNLSAAFGFGIKMVFLLLFERIFGWGVVWCNLAALMISGLVNFLLAEKIVFRKPGLLPIVDSQVQPWKKNKN